MTLNFPLILTWRIHWSMLAYIHYGKQSESIACTNDAHILYTELYCLYCFFFTMLCIWLTAYHVMEYVCPEGPCRVGGTTGRGGEQYRDRSVGKPSAEPGSRRRRWQREGKETDNGGWPGEQLWMWSYRHIYPSLSVCHWLCVLSLSVMWYPVAAHAMRGVICNLY